MEDYQQNQEVVSTVDSLVGRIRKDLSLKGFSRLANLSVDTEKQKGVSISGKINGTFFYVSLPAYGECKYMGYDSRVISKFQEKVMDSLDCDSNYEPPFNLRFFSQSKAI